MMEDLPMADSNPNADAEMIDYDDYDYEMQDDAPVAAPTTDVMPEYEMGMEYGESMPTEGDVMVADEPPTVDIPIVEELPANPSVPVPTEVPTAIPAAAVPILPAPPEIFNPPQLSSTVEVPVVVPQAITSEPAPPEPSVSGAAAVAETTHSPTPPIATHEAHTPPAAPIAEVPPAPHVSDPEPPQVVIPEVLPEPEPAITNLPEESPDPAVSEDATQIPHHDAVETAPEVLEDAPIVIPPITLYFDEVPLRVFFSMDENADPASTVLPGQGEWYTLPIAQFLGALKQQEGHRFPGIEECVLGLEYQELDLCIDENSKYALSFTLKDLCDALIACNHPQLDFALFQVSDFAQALHQRLKGVLPPYNAASEHTEANEEPPLDVAAHAEPEVHQLNEVEEAPASATAEVTQTHEEEPVQTTVVETPQLEAEPATQQPTEDHQSATAVSNYEVEPPVTITEAAPDEVPSSQVPTVEEQEAEYESEYGQYEEDAVGEDEDEPAQEAESLPVPVDDPVTNAATSAKTDAESTSNSSHTLESSAHDGLDDDAEGDGHTVGQAAENYADDEFPDDDVDELEPPPHFSEVESAVVDPTGDVQHRAASEAGEAVPTKGQSHSQHTSNEDSDAAGDYEEYDQYQDQEDQLAPFATDDEQPEPLPSVDVTDPDLTIVQSVSGSKRGYEEVQGDATSEYEDLEENYESDSKRARVE